MNAVGLFLLGWIGLSFAVVGVVLVMRAVQVRDRLGPGTSGARELGCLCPPRKNWYGWREAVTDRSFLGKGCPVLLHRYEVRAAHFSG